MTDITIIGTGNMARGLASRAVAAGKSVQLLAHQDKAKADDVAAGLGGQVTTGCSATPWTARSSWTSPTRWTSPPSTA